MAANILSYGNDLDNIFKPRQSSKRADVGYTVAGTDISNRYEKTFNWYDQYGGNTNILTGGTDLRYLFQRAGAYYVNRFDIVTTEEKPEKYIRRRDGTMTVSVDTRYARVYGGHVYLRVTIHGVASQDKYVYVGEGSTTVDFVFGGLSGDMRQAEDKSKYVDDSSTGEYCVTVQDLYSGASRYVCGIIVIYDRYNWTYANYYSYY